MNLKKIFFYLFPPSQVFALLEYDISGIIVVNSDDDIFSIPNLDSIQSMINLVPVLMLSKSDGEILFSRMKYQHLSNNNLMDSNFKAKQPSFQYFKAMIGSIDNCSSKVIQPDKVSNKNDIVFKTRGIVKNLNHTATITKETDNFKHDDSVHNKFIQEPISESESTASEVKIEKSFVGEIQRLVEMKKSSKNIFKDTRKSKILFDQLSKKYKLGKENYTKNK